MEEAAVTDEDERGLQAIHLPYVVARAPSHDPGEDRPELALDSSSRLHIAWYSDVVTQTTGITTRDPII